MSNTGKYKISAIKKFLSLRKVKRWYNRAVPGTSSELYRNSGFMLKVEWDQHGCEYTMHMKVHKPTGGYQWYYERYRYAPATQQKQDHLFMLKNGVYPDWVANKK